MVIFGLSNLNSGEDRYLSNSDNQSCALEGGRLPVTGLHSVMLNLRPVSLDHQAHTNGTHPDSVSRVSPPNTTIPNTLAALPKSQYATALWLVSGKERLLVKVCLEFFDWLNDDDMDEGDPLELEDASKVTAW